MEQDRAAQAAYGTPGVESATSTMPTARAGMNPQSFFLAGIGALATACDEAETYYNRFVERGRQVQHDLRDQADSVRARNTATTFRVRDAFRSAMDAFLDTLNVPNKGDVDTINVKLNILTRKIDDLQARTDADAGPPSMTQPPTTDLGT